MQVNTSGKTKSASKGTHGTSVEVYKTCLGAYDPSGGQVNTSGKTKYMPKEAHGPFTTHV